MGLALLCATCLPTPTALSVPLRADDPLAFGSEPPPKPVDAPQVRFAVLGDVGNKDAVQGTIARGVHRACAGTCDFVVLLGDNLYDEGMAEQDDEERLACIVRRYPSQHAFMALGNHDYHKLAPTLDRARTELHWIRKTTAANGGVEARGGFHFYKFQAGPVDFVSLDTNYLVRSKFRVDYEDLMAWLGPLRRKEGRWTIAMGHHPYWSNGSHGNAGAYRDGGLSLWPGKFFRHFMDQHVVGRAHMYLAGHDHNLQFFGRLDGQDTAQLSSGSGAKCRGRGDAPNTAMMERYGFGFALVDATTNQLSVSYHDFEGTEFWAATRTREKPEWTVTKAPAQSVDVTDRCDEERARMTTSTAQPDPCSASR